MNSIAFFSYKGGVGRTMALTNLAMRLVEFGKSVMILDFDLEAPGVPFKLKTLVSKKDIQGGIVDYIHHFSSKGEIDDISKYVIDLTPHSPNNTPFWLLPAGNSDVSEYWNKLSRINWHSMFYSIGGNGLKFFLNLKNEIKKKYNPDFLLIDSRTGITELSGISLKILADEVVLLFVNNLENIEGTGNVLKFLKDSSRIGPEIYLVLTRVENPHGDRIKYNQEYKLLESLKKQFNENAGRENLSISVIHTDNSLQMDEDLAFIRNDVGIHSEHMSLFEHMFKNKFTTEEWARWSNKSQAEEYFLRAHNAKNEKESILFLTKSIELDPTNWHYLFSRGRELFLQGNIQGAIKDMEDATRIAPSNVTVKRLLIVLYSNFGRGDLALKLLEEIFNKLDPQDSLWLRALVLHKSQNTSEAISAVNEGLEKFPDSHILLNTRADIYRRTNRLEEALIDVTRAIELDSNQPVYIGTLAEIYCAQNRMEEFYLTLSNALEKGMSIVEMRTAKDAYEKVRYEPRFIETLKSYNMNSEYIFNNLQIEDYENS